MNIQTKVACVFLLVVSAPFGRTQCVPVNNVNADDIKIGNSTLGSPPFTPWDLLHIRYFTGRANCYINPLYKGSALRLDYQDGEYFGQLALIDPNNTFGPQISAHPNVNAKDLILRASCNAQDIILNTQSPQGAIRFITTSQSDLVCQPGYPTIDPPPSPAQRESMTIMNNGFIGMGTSDNDVPQPRGWLHLHEKDYPSMDLILFPGSWHAGIRANFSEDYTPPNTWTHPRIVDGCASFIEFEKGDPNAQFTGGIRLNAQPWGAKNSEVQGYWPNDQGMNLHVRSGDCYISHSDRGFLFRVIPPTSAASSDAGTGWTYIKSRTLIGTEGINYSGAIDVPSTTTQPLMLAVNGLIKAKEAIVEVVRWPDYVFDKNYQLTALNDVEDFIKENKHLPGLPSAKQIKDDGVIMGEMQAKLLEKIEELTLYMIQLEKENQDLKSSLKNLTQRLNVFLEQ